MKKKQTKIVATVSSIKCSPEFIRELYDTGVNVIRLNTAHQTPKESLVVINNIRKVSDRIGIMIDTKGPEVRIAALQEEIVYAKGENLLIAGYEAGQISAKEKIYVNYPSFCHDVPVGSSIFVDDGKMEMRVREKAGKYLDCEIMNDGLIKPNKSVNVPGVHLDIETISKKDLDFIRFSIKNKIDFIAHSFVRNQEDILAIRKILDRAKSDIKIISKIENREGVKNIDEIIEHSDGIMIARGDLGIEVPAEEIPLIQKEIIRKCIVNSRPVIVATQMLQSMVKNPRPTRAEVSDVANAVIDGADAIMLSEESANGDYPIEAVEVMSRIASKVEASNEKYQIMTLPTPKNENVPANYLIKAAILAANELDVKEIIIASTTGVAAGFISSHRSRIPVYLKCYDRAVVRQLALSYGITAHYVKKEEDHKRFITKLFNQLVKDGKLTLKDKVIFLASDTRDGSETSLMEICDVGKYVSIKK